MSVVGEDTDVRITPPTAGDAEQLALVHVQCWREAYGRLLPERFYGDEARERRLAMCALGSGRPRPRPGRPPR